MHSLPEPTPASIRAYTRLGLRLYDALVMGVLANHVWGCPAARLVEHYRRHVTPNHADIGVGTGFCLERSGLEPTGSRLALIDLQPNCLAHAARRLARHRPTSYVRDALRPLHGIEPPAFDSIALGGVLHCLAGDFESKSRVFDHLRPLAAPGSKVFGYTLVSDDVALRLRRRFVHGVLNRSRIIDNAGDRVAELRRTLALRFDDCRVDLIGCMALFSAVVPARIFNPERRSS
jgi:methyltransferase family protein